MEKAQHLNELAQAQIAELRNAGIVLTDDELIWINDLARRVDNPPGGSTLPAGCPVQAGNVWLWPFTVQSAAWYDKAVNWFDGQGEMETYCLAYALAHGRIEGASDKVWNYTNARFRVTQWRDHLACTHEELISAIAQVLPKADELGLEDDTGDKDDKPEKETDWSGLVASLVAAVGGDPDIWTRQVSKEFLLKQANTIAEQHREKGQAPDPGDPCIRAQVDLGRAVTAIKKRHAGNG